MKTVTNIIRTAAVILTIILTTANFAQAGNPASKSAPSSKVLNPNFDPNKKIVNVRTEPLINRDRQAGESFLNRNREPLINRKFVPKKYVKAQYYK